MAVAKANPEIELDEVFGTDRGDVTVWARTLTAGKARKGKKAPQTVDLADAITNISITDTMKGSSTIVLSVSDPEWLLVETGFFDVNRDGRIDAIDVNYPDGSDLWWRCTQLSLDASGGAQLGMTFMERSAVHLMNKKGPLKVSRAKRTRSEFIRQLVREVKVRRIAFHSHELHKKQRVAPITAEEAAQTEKREKQDEKERREAKNKGIAAGANLTVKGAKATKLQLERGEKILDTADRLNASEKVMVAIIVAAIGESEMGANVGARGTTFQTTQIPESQLGVQAHHWLTGGRSFLAGGGIGYAKAHPQASVGEIASKVEISDKGGSFYDAYAPEAREWVEAYGGPGTTGGGEYRTQYNFEVGSPENPHENFWDAIQRMADEVKWAFFMDGHHAYFDSELTLIRQKPVAVIRRGHPSVVSFSANWDQRDIATEAELELICNPFEFRAGECFKLEGWGPASTGSTAKPPLPGRWLIESWTRERFALTTRFSLKQPEDPEPEPRTSLAQRQEKEDEDAANGGGGGAYGGGKESGTQLGSPVPGQPAAAHRPGTPGYHETSGLAGYPAFDYMAPGGSPCVAPVSGKIVRQSGRAVSAATCPPGGPCGYSLYLDGDDGNSYFMTHLDKIRVKAGQRVQQGYQIAELAKGPSSWSSPHVHMGVKRGGAGGYGKGGGAD